MTETTNRKLWLCLSSSDQFWIGAGDKPLDVTGTADVTIKGNTKTIRTPKWDLLYLPPPRQLNLRINLI